MSDWTSGYVADVDYTYGYYPELNPLRTRLAFLNAGLLPPKIETACELGFGQGISTNIHAAATPISWFGTDFNPAQARYAQDLASLSRNGAELVDDDFKAYLSRTDLPDFDFIGLHGIWSWISDENRRVIVDFIRKKLKVGGVVYVSYNTLPGWATFAPVRHLMTEHAEVLGADGIGLLNKIDAAMDFSKRVLGLSARYTHSHPTVNDKLIETMAKSKHYLAHEYFNRDWDPMYFADMVSWMQPAKIEYANSAAYKDHIRAIDLSLEQIEFLDSITDPMFQQSTRDFLVNETFRKDYWIRGLRKLTRGEQQVMLSDLEVVLTTPSSLMSLKTQGAQGEVNLKEELYLPLIELLSDHSQRSLGEITAQLGEDTFSLDLVVQAITILTHMGHIAPAQNRSSGDSVIANTKSLNGYLIEQSRYSTEVTFLASPVTGGGVQVNRVERMYLDYQNSGVESESDWATNAATQLAAQGHKLMDDGVALEPGTRTNELLSKMAHEFKNHKIPMLRSLKIIN